MPSSLHFRLARVGVRLGFTIRTPHSHKTNRLFSSAHISRKKSDFCGADREVAFLINDLKQGRNPYLRTNKEFLKPVTEDVITPQEVKRIEKFGQHLQKLHRRLRDPYQNYDRREVQKTPREVSYFLQRLNEQEEKDQLFAGSKQGDVAVESPSESSYSSVDCSFATQDTPPASAADYSSFLTEQRAQPFSTVGTPEERPQPFADVTGGDNQPAWDATPSSAQDRAQPIAKVAPESSRQGQHATVNSKRRPSDVNKPSLDDSKTPLNSKFLNKLRSKDPYKDRERKVAESMRLAAEYKERRRSEKEQQEEQRFQEERQREEPKQAQPDAEEASTTSSSKKTSWWNFFS